MDSLDCRYHQTNMGMYFIWRLAENVMICYNGENLGLLTFRLCTSLYLSSTAMKNTIKYESHHLA